MQCRADGERPEFESRSGYRRRLHFRDRYATVDSQIVAKGPADELAPPHLQLIGLGQRRSLYDSD